ncbi:MAG: DUF2306 domain-containing protein [Janibacter sp.]
MGRTQVNRPGRGWGAVALVSLMYLPMAALAMGPYFLDDPTAVVSQLPEGGFRGFVEGALAGRAGPYQAHLMSMVFHTLTGALLMGLGPYLLWSRPRRRTRSHVIAGRLYLATALASMTGALVFLVGEPLEAAFTGPVFALGLWGMLVGTVSSALLGWVAALRHQIRLHVLWVCLNYGFLVSAPLLRLEWGLFGAFGVGDTLEEVSPQSAIHIVAVSTTLAVLGSLHLADRFRPKGATLGTALGSATSSGPQIPRALVLGSVAVGAGALAVVGSRYLEHGTAATTHLAWYAVPMLVLIGIVETFRRRALAAGRRELAEEHLVLLCWLALSPVIALGIAVLARAWLALEPAVADATGVTLSGGLAVVFAVQTMHARLELAGRRRHSGPAPRSRSRETSAAS